MKVDIVGSMPIWLIKVLLFIKDISVVLLMLLYTFRLHHGLLGD